MFRNNKKVLGTLLLILTSGILFLFGGQMLAILGYTGGLVFELKLVSFGFMLGATAVKLITVNDLSSEPSGRIEKIVIALLATTIGVLVGLGVIWMAVASSGVIAFLVLGMSIIFGVYTTVRLFMGLVNTESKDL